MKNPNLGEFEELVLLAVCALREPAYAVSLQRYIEDRANRSVMMGAVYGALDRLVKKGYLDSRLGNITHRRGGRRKRYYHLTSAGMAAIWKVRDVRERMWQDIDLKPALR